MLIIQTNIQLDLNQSMTKKPELKELSYSFVKH